MRQPDFDRIYEDVPTEQKQMLWYFRANHPEKTVTVKGTDVPYTVSGQGDKTLLFIAGGFAGTDMWFYPISVLEKDYRVISVGFPKPVLTYDDYNDALVRIMQVEVLTKRRRLASRGAVARHRRSSRRTRRRPNTWCSATPHRSVLS